ncbi:MAG: hypothetical protein ACFE0K_10165, partial [Alcanivorax sp.]|uniref:hypothetical protein n=1 Tax=Alcanivorax sp. TaxID=1872427 RepID=UPI003DA6E5D2
CPSTTRDTPATSALIDRYENAFRFFLFVPLSMLPPKICSAKPADDQNPGAIFSVMADGVKNLLFL